MAAKRSTKAKPPAPPARALSGSQQTAAKKPRRNLNRPEGGWAGESGADRRAAGQSRWEAWLTEGEDDDAKAKADAWGLTKSALVRKAIELMPSKPK